MIGLPNKYTIPVHSGMDLMAVSYNFNNATYIGKILVISQELGNRGYS
jgi:hypothetical protein